MGAYLRFAALCKLRSRFGIQINGLRDNLAAWHDRCLCRGMNKTLTPPSPSRRAVALAEVARLHRRLAGFVAIFPPVSVCAETGLQPAQIAGINCPRRAP